jgi:hypothetical protein
MIRLLTLAVFFEFQFIGTGHGQRFFHRVPSCFLPTVGSGVFLSASLWSRPTGGLNCPGRCKIAVCPPVVRQNFHPGSENPVEIGSESIAEGFQPGFPAIVPDGDGAFRVHVGPSMRATSRLSNH